MTLKEKQNLVLSLAFVRNQTFIATETQITMLKFYTPWVDRIVAKSNLQKHNKNIKQIKSLKSLKNLQKVKIFKKQPVKSAFMQNPALVNLS